MARAIEGSPHSNARSASQRLPASAYPRAQMPLRIKGAAFHQLLHTYEDARGAAFRAAVITSTRGPGGEALRHNELLASSMVPIDWYVSMLRAAAELSGGGLVFTRQMGHLSAAHDIGTIHRVVFRLLSIDTIVHQIPRLIALYYDGGRGELLGHERGRIRLKLRDFVGFDDHAWHDFSGGAEAMIVATGVSSVRSRITSGGTSDHAEIEITY